ncbi:MAG TPA: hypothetical protein IAB65_01200 [Candidatus Onthocola stercorigallinarum]|jgi:hypothetical protein|nr:hypothetical protein [Candidatus Onthocola stercorigallinarum]
MSKFKYLILSLLIFGFGITPVGAICNYEEQAALNREVSNVSANYEIVENALPDNECFPPDPNDEDYVCYVENIQINILNLSENMRVRIRNENNNITREFSYSDTDSGSISFLLTDRNGNEVSYNPEVTEYTITILASGETGCEGTTLRTLYLTLPRYNRYSDYQSCETLSDYYLCQRYVTFSEVNYEDFSQRVSEELQNREETPEEELRWYERIWEFVVEHSTAFIIGGVIIVVSAGAVTAYIIIRRKREII